jgi:hypothetical protein
MLKGIIFNSVQGATGFKTRVNNANKQKYKGVTNQFSSIIKHPTESKWAYIIEEKFEEYYIGVINSPELVVELGESWINNIEF